MSRRFGFVSWCVCGSFLVTLNGSAGAQAPPSFFKQLDKNGDGKVTPDEFPARIARLFEQIDANGDGAITPEEDAAFRRVTAPGDAPRLPASVKGEFDVPYADGKNVHQKLDLLLPKEPADGEPLPVIVYIHGGKWSGGSKRDGIPFLVHSVAAGNYVGVTIDYRLSNEATWPAQIHDCKAALRWLRAHAKKYGLDPQRIGVIGTSAGGHLAAMLGTSGNIDRLEGKVGDNLDESSRVSCVVDEFGPSELLAMSGFPSDIEHDSPDSPESRLIGGALQDHKDAARSASPITYVSADDPPFLLIHGTDDPLVPYDQSERLLGALEEERVDARLIKVQGGGHGGFRSAELDRRIRLFFDKHLRHLEDVEIPDDPIQPGQKRAEAAAK
ncbi:MAG TPA: alpha/beta hydrolase fold domain-containing protein [Pirellulales bacterium]|nr:alpha/beta hydrolase fold domain-containing protein [Pirellulales bacterium]